MIKPVLGMLLAASLLILGTFYVDSPMWLGFGEPETARFRRGFSHMSPFAKVLELTEECGA